METDCYVTSRRWEEEVKEERRQEKEKAKVVVGSLADPSLQKRVEIASGDRVTENAETRQNMGPADAVRMMRAKLETEEGKEVL